MQVEKRKPGRVPAIWQPFQELEDMSRRFQNLFRRWPLSSWEEPTLGFGQWAPSLDIYEKEDHFVVTAELPGMKEKDIDVSIVGDTLTVKGEKKADTEVKKENYYRAERNYGAFWRSIALPVGVDAAKVEASYVDGVLTVTLPKTSGEKTKKVMITAKAEKT